MNDISVNNEVKYFSHIGERDNDAANIIKEANELTMAAIDKHYSGYGVKTNYSLSETEYSEKNKKVKEAWLAYAAAKSGVTDVSDKKHLAYAFENPTFVALTNAITVENLLGVVTNVNPAGLMNFVNISDVDVGDSKTFTLETKGLPVAQRGSYNNNVVLPDSASGQGKTIVPKIYTLGTSIDYIRILQNTFDFGKEMARVALGLLFAQYKLCSSKLFATTNLTGTPLYQSVFSQATYVKLISYLQALNGTSAVSSYGTIPAYQAISALATQSRGFMTQDEMVRNGYLGQIYGIQSNIISQATDLSAPFTSASADNLMLIPNNEIILMSDSGDKPVKLVRENFIRVITDTPTSGALYRMQYSYTMAFDADLITQSHYAIQGTSGT